MDIRQLRYFIGVLEAKSLNKASALLHVAQPALSTQIRNLETELGVKLLHRHARGVVPTKAGERFAQHICQLLRQIDHMRMDLSGYAMAPSGGVLMCIARSIPLIVTATIAERCRQQLPDVQLKILEGWRQQAQSDRLTADLALTFHPEQGTSFFLEPLVQDELVLIYSADERQRTPEIDLCLAIQQSLILPSRPHYVRQFVETAAHSIRREIMIACEIDSFDVIKELVARNVAKAILPVAAVQEEARKGKLGVARIRNPRLLRTLNMLHSSRQERSTATDAVCSVVRAVIFECADSMNFGWRRMSFAETLSDGNWGDRHNPEGLVGEQSTILERSVFGSRMM